jgi:hypothetical protein
VYEPPLVDYRTGRILNPGGYREKGDPSYLAGSADALAPGLEKVQPYVYGTGEFLGGFMPVIGEYQDIDLVADRAAPAWMRWMAGGSLLVNLVVPELPNAGGLFRGGTRATDANKLSHIFGKAEHGLEGVVKQFGSQAAAFEAMQQAAEAAVKAKKLTGVFEVTVKVGGEMVTVRGNVIEGVVKIGTAFK